MNLQFIKMQGVGNDFIVVDARALPALDWPALAPRLCDRRFGIGADGILLIEEAPPADAAMRMFNPDGTEDFCGNGLRCVARFVAGASRQPAGAGPSELGNQNSVLRIATVAGTRRAEVQPGGSVTVEMGEPLFAPEEIPLAEGVWTYRDHSPLTTQPLVRLELSVDGETLTAFPLSTGTTHTILFVDELPEDERFFRLSPKIEHHPAFPDRTSVMWTKIVAPNRLRLRIWERGAGETWGCGTGACAAAVAARQRGYTGDETVVASKGGELSIQWDGSGPILMTGPAVYVFRGSVEI